MSTESNWSRINSSVYQLNIKPKLENWKILELQKYTTDYSYNIQYITKCKLYKLSRCWMLHGAIATIYAIYIHIHHSYRYGYFYLMSAVLVPFPSASLPPAYFSIYSFSIKLLRCCCWYCIFNFASPLYAYTTFTCDFSVHL